MDFNQFDSRAAADEGRDLHLKHPATGEPLFDDGEPCIVIVRGSEGREVQKEMAKLRAAKAAEAKDDDQALIDITARLVDATRPLVVGFKNIYREDKPAKVPDDVDWFLGLQMVNGQPGEQSFVEQVTGFATRRANFLGVTSKG